MSEPLVSVMVPCYNSAASLPWALGSMLAQTYQNWECIVVDDGSDDDPGAVIEAAEDPRIRLIRFPENRGRPYARQAALDAARGDFLAMVDADDWIYPEKLERQVASMLAHPELVLVSAGMMILEQDGSPAGVRCVGPAPGLMALPEFRRLGSVPVAHGPTMVRMAVAKQMRYDTVLKHSEDMDFLLRVLLGRRYGVSGDLHYVYSEHASVTPEKILHSLELNRHIYRNYLTSNPVASRAQLFVTWGKSIAYRAAFRLGLHERMVRHRSATPSSDQFREFEQARAAVCDMVALRWPGAATRPTRAVV